MPEWDRELVVDSRAVWRAAGAPSSWRLLGTGWDCDAWIADESVVWRVPRRPGGIGALRREAAVMPILASRLPAAVPVPRLVEIDGLPPLTSHVMIPGQELGLATTLGAGLGASTGAFLSALHVPGLVREAAACLPIDPMGRADPARRLPIAHRRLDDISTLFDVARLRGIVDAAAGPPQPVESVCHGDLHIRHVLVDSAGELSGVIDWGDCCVGARAMDLAVVTAMDPDTRRSFFAAYATVDESAWRHARMLGVTFGASLLAADPGGAVGNSARSWLERLADES